jgi:ferredoxin--NADP+ reductase
MRLDDYDRSRQVTAMVVSSTRLTPADADAEIRELILEVKDPVAYAPGQSIGVLVPPAAARRPAPHFRLYSVADAEPPKPGDWPRITIAVRRVTWEDEYTQERRQGIASHYLCDLRVGASLSITGPYGYVFELPDAPDVNLILISMGTGIAPFRAYVQHLYTSMPDYSGRVWLFYGARTGLEHVYMNDERDDFTLYYDRETFEAFKAVSPRPDLSEPIAWDDCLGARSEEILAMLEDGRSRIYVAGVEEVRPQLDDVFARLFGTRHEWQQRQQALLAAGRWTELLY